jgi:hypothetical protein
MFQQISLDPTRLGTLALGSLSSPALGGQILNDDFNGTGGVPKNWVQILGATGDVTEKPQNLTMTDSTESSAGIASLVSLVVKPQEVMTTSTVQINNVNGNGNAIFGLIGLDSTGTSLIGELGAGIDIHGNVFIVEYQKNPSINQTIVPIGVVKGYTGGSMLLNFIVNSMGVEVTAPGFNSGEILFSKDLNGFSLAAAFSNGAIPALVAASQPNEKGGLASFASINVVTAVASPVP